MTGHGRWERLEGVVDLELLRRKHVLVVGLGSGGSTVALELAKAGVGALTLVDPDVLETSNVIRHECDARYLGSGKAAAVSELVRFRNTHAEVEAVRADVFELGQRLAELVARADVVAVCTDGEAPKHLLNRTALSAGVPAVYGGVYERGTGGEIVRCGGGPEDPCFACVTSVLKETVPLPDGEGELDYGAVDGDGTVHGAPGLGLDVRLIALLHAKVCLLGLLAREEELPGDAVLFGTAAIEGLFPRPLASALVTVKPQEGCLVCAPFRRGQLADRPRHVRDVITTRTKPAGTAQSPSRT